MARDGKEQVVRTRVLADAIADAAADGQLPVKKAKRKDSRSSSLASTSDDVLAGLMPSADIQSRRIELEEKRLAFQETIEHKRLELEEKRMQSDAEEKKAFYRMMEAMISVMNRQTPAIDRECK